MFDRKTRFGALIMTAVCARPALAHAQAREPPDGDAEPKGEVPVHLVAQTEELGYHVYSAEAEPGQDYPVGTCTGSCWMRLPPGKYRLVLRDTAEVSGGQRVFEIEESSRVLLSPGSSTAAYVGLTFGILGSVAIFAGAVLMTPAVLSSGCHNGDRCETNETMTGIGFLLLVGGAIATPVGWSAFARNRKPRADVEPLRNRQAFRTATHAAFTLRPVIGVHDIRLSAEVGVW